MFDPIKANIHNLYIRFGKIPTDEQSNMKLHMNKIGKEQGVSCYHVHYIGGKYLPILPIPCTEDTLCTIDYCLHEASTGQRPVYIISGDEVGLGLDKEPLLKNITIMEDISNEYIGMYEEI